MRTKVWRIVLAGAIALMLIGIAPAGAEQSQQANVQASIQTRSKMQHATNHSRVTHGVHRVWLNALMSELARRHSLKMAKAGRLFHTSDPASFYLRGVRWRVWGENVGVTGGSVPMMESAFMASPPHRANILKPSYKHTAIGAVRYGGKLWITVFFYG
jgi:uncharacterized protein YkwD